MNYMQYILLTFNIVLHCKYEKVHSSHDKFVKAGDKL